MSREEVCRSWQGSRHLGPGYTAASPLLLQGQPDTSSFPGVSRSARKDIAGQKLFMCRRQSTKHKRIHIFGIILIQADVTLDLKN